MSALSPAPFVPPSESFVWRLGDTPLSDLLRGHVTGAGNPRRLLAQSALPDPIVAGVWQVACARASRRAALCEHASQLIHWSRRQLAGGRTVDDVAAELKERATLARFLPWKAFADDPLTVRLPEGLRQTIERLLTTGLWRLGARKHIARALYEKWIAELSLGTPPERLIATFADAGDVASLLRRPEICSLALESDLPVSLLKIVQGVVRATRLWPGERHDVARELCAHFADGLAGGRTAEELAESFGSVRTAAKLIRRAQLRKRSPFWQLWRRGCQAMAATVLLAIVFWSAMIARLHWAGAPTRVDFVGQVDAARSAIPADDRAWPLYREALENFTATPVTVGSINSILIAGPTHEQWPLALEHLSRNEELLALAVRGASRPQFGFIYRDPENNTWLKKTLYRPVDELYPEFTLTWETHLPQVQELLNLDALLSGAAHREASAGRGRQAAVYLAARIRLASQLLQSAEFPIIEAASTYWFSSGADAIALYAFQRHELFADQDLQRLQLAVASYGDGRLRTEALRQLVGPSLQSLFSDDGDGNGRLTASGIRDLRRMLAGASSVPPEIADWKIWLAATSPLYPPLEPKWWEAAQAELAGSTLVSVVADRRETLACAENLLTLLEEDMELPFWSTSPSEFDAELTRIKTSPELRHKFMPVLLVVSTLTAFADRALIMQGASARDKALVAIALEQYRRQHGSFPKRLERLIPEFLAAVPIDPYDGQPIRYLPREGRPLVYSVFLDKKDDTALMAPKAQDRGASESDWQWLPPIKPSAK